MKVGRAVFAEEFGERGIRIDDLLSEPEDFADIGTQMSAVNAPPDDAQTLHHHLADDSRHSFESLYQRNLRAHMSAVNHPPDDAQTLHHPAHILWVVQKVDMNLDG